MNDFLLLRLRWLFVQPLFLVLFYFGVLDYACLAYYFYLRGRSSDFRAEYVTAAVFCRFSTWAQSSQRIFFNSCLLPISFEASQGNSNCAAGLGSLPLKVSSSLNALSESSLELCVSNNTKSNALQVTAFAAICVCVYVSVSSRC